MLSSVDLILMRSVEYKSIGKFIDSFFNLLLEFDALFPELSSVGY